jgi:hypothetical protein
MLALPVLRGKELQEINKVGRPKGSKWRPSSVEGRESFILFGTFRPKRVVEGFKHPPADVEKSV